MDNFEELVRHSEQLLIEGSTIFRQLNNGIEEIGKIKDYDPKYTLIARMMLMDSNTLAGEITLSLGDKHLLLPLIGVRSLFESLINAAYIYAHPKHNHELNWIVGVCKDFIDRANNADAIKQKLGGVSIVQRAQEVGLEAQYYDTIGGLSNFSHMIGFSPTQINPHKIEMMYRAAYIQTLSSILDIYQVMQKHFKLQEATQWHNEVINFCDKNAVDFINLP